MSRGLAVNRWLLGRGWRSGLEQLPFLHGHHERAGGIRSRFALEIQTGTLFGDEPQRHLVFESESDIRLLRVDVIRAAGDVELGRRGLDDGPIHLYSLALDRVPDDILVFLGAIGKDELPSGEVHLFRLLRGHQSVNLFRRGGSGFDGKSSGLSWAGLGLRQNVSPAVVSSVILCVLTL